MYKTDMSGASPKNSKKDSSIQPNLETHVQIKYKDGTSYASNDSKSMIKPNAVDLSTLKLHEKS
jgi:hypothetical protein